MNYKALWYKYFSVVGAWTPAITPQASLAWVEFGGIPLDCWCEDLFKRLGWAVGETLLIEEETMDRSTLANGRVLVLIPNGQLCPDVVKVESRKRTFNVTVREDSELISYKMILNWLDLDWDESDSETGSSTVVVKGDKRVDSNSVKEDEELVVMPSPNQGEPQKISRVKTKSNDKGKQASDWRVEASNASVSGRAIMDYEVQLMNKCEGINEVNDEVALVVDKSDSCNFASKVNF